MPGFMEQLLEELGWNKGTRVPLASEDNKKLESLLNARQDEIQRLKEASTQQRQKQADLDRYRQHVTSEGHENMKLLLVQKQQLEGERETREEHRRRREQLERDTLRTAKESCDVRDRIDRAQSDIARHLKRADALKSEVCGERGALAEWREALARSAGDIAAFEQFNKQDLTKAKDLETKRLRVKGEHDRLHERVIQLFSNLAADERAAETLSTRVEVAREDRRRVMSAWALAVENLRQRDRDIRHTREDYSELETEVASQTEVCRERQQFAEQLAADNEEGERECVRLAMQLAQLRTDCAQRREDNKALQTHVNMLQSVLGSMRRALHELRAHSKSLRSEQQRLDEAGIALEDKISELKEKKIQSLDKTRSAKTRARELQEMLNEEEKYASGLMKSQQRAMLCSFNQRQKLNALKEHDVLAHVQIRSTRAAMSQLDVKQQQVEKELMAQKETLYNVTYQVQTQGARVARMEGATAERECDAKLVAREKCLQEVCGIHATRVAMLSNHSDKLRDEMRRLTRDLALHAQFLDQLQCGVRSRMVAAEGRKCAIRDARDEWRRARVEESLMKLRVAHGTRAVANLDNFAYTLNAQRLQMDAAMNERRVEVEARVAMFSVQKRTLVEDCSKLRLDARERHNRIEQLQKRYDIFIASLGKDDSGQQLSVTFFKIKFASERAELRAQGAELDAQIECSEREVEAMEATLRVMHAAHQHFVHHVSPLNDDEEEMKLLSSLSDEYYALHAALQELRGRRAQQEECVEQLRGQHTLLTDKQKQLRAREAETESEWEAARERLARQEGRLENAREVVRAHSRRARRMLPDTDSLRLFQMELWCRDYAEAAYSALRALVEAGVGGGAADAAARVAELAAQLDLADKLPRQHRRCHALLQRLLMGRQTSEALQTGGTSSSSVMSAGSAGAGGDAARDSSGSAAAHDGFSRRLSSFRRGLATRLGDRSLLDEEVVAKSSRSSVTLSVVTLGFDQEPVRDRP